MRISKESSSKTSLLFSIRKWHDSQNEMVTMLIYNAFYGVTMHVSLSLHQGVVAKRLDGSRRSASLNIGNMTEASRSNAEVYFRLQDRSHGASFYAFSECGV